jgi:hypothetical protein
MQTRTRAIVVLFLITSASCGPNSDGSRLREVSRLKQAIPIFPSMRPGLSGDFSRWNLAGSILNYESPAAYEDVEGFYLRKLATDWVFAGEIPFQEWGRDLGGRELIFCNRSEPEYSFVVTFRGEKSSGIKYALAVWWKEGGRPGCVPATSVNTE